MPRLPDDAIDRIIALMRAAGMTAKMSSIHVNGWFGAYDKLAMTRTLLRDEFGIDVDAERDRFIFVGDSPNDAPMFEHFPYSVGVANVRAFAGRIATPPALCNRARVRRGIRRAGSASARRALAAEPQAAGRVSRPAKQAFLRAELPT